MNPENMTKALAKPVLDRPWAESITIIPSTPVSLINKMDVMKSTNFLIILQYNIRNDRVITIIPLLAEKSIQDYNIIAIQEPWHNPSAPTTLSSHQSGFHLFYCPESNTCVCFYINNTINPESWKVEFPLPNMCTLKIITYTNRVSKLIHIHNVYNPFPLSYGSIDSLSTLSVIKEQLNAEVHHILLRDFNLYYPFWNNLLRSTYHAMAD